MQIKEFDVVLDIKTRDIAYRDTATKDIIDIIEFVQGDYLTNKLNIYIQDGEKPYDLEGSVVSIIFKKYDGTVIIMSIEDGNVSVEGNVITCILSTNAIAIPGR